MNKKRISLWRRLAPYLAGAAVIALLALGFRPAPLLVDAEQVARGHLEVTIEDEGRTRVVDRYQISAPIAAQTRRITLEVGDAVAAGDVLATLDAVAAPALDMRSMQSARAQVAAASAMLASAREEVKAAEAAAGFARNESVRLDRLGKDGVVPKNMVEQAQTEARRADAALASARFRVRTAEYELAAARTALAHAGGQDAGVSGVLQLRSPVPGRVLRRHFESTRVVQPGEPILDIGDPARLEAEIDVLSSDAVRIAPGMRVWLERWGSADPLEGVVKRIEPTGFTKISALGVEEQRVWVIVDIVSPPEQWSRLGDGYRVNARFVLWESDDVLKVPTSSLFRNGAGWAAFVEEDGRVRLCAVQIGQRGTLYSEVTAGLAAGETVIAHPDRDLADGRRVRLRE
ncbi:MAG TPA: HlyD family efflux transporter periplasmic adaptor subunit [Burkholderiales bacterium]|nr:HlyD family efflux transporter periplasmic adaptor subunit [Burkholderiales bacterium]